MCCQIALMHGDTLVREDLPLVHCLIWLDPSMFAAPFQEDIQSIFRHEGTASCHPRFNLANAF